MTRVGNTSRPIGSDGLVGREREILELWDQGLNKAKIIEQTGLAERTVTNALYRVSPSSSNPFDAMVRRGSELLLAALRRHHPDICGAPAGRLPGLGFDEDHSLAARSWDRGVARGGSMPSSNGAEGRNWVD
jgi:hypothetical protein